MPARNIYHDVVVKALIADGWTITHDPLPLPFEGRKLEVDLGAERSVIGAKKAEEKIAVEVQSFLSDSPVRDLEEALGQIEIYRVVLGKTEPERKLFMAVPGRVQRDLLSDKFGKFVVKEFALSVIVFDEDKSRIIKWQP